MTTNPGQIGADYIVTLADESTVAHIVAGRNYADVDRNGGDLVGLCGHRSHTEPGIEDRAWSLHFTADRAGRGYDGWPVCFECVRRAIGDPGRVLPSWWADAEAVAW
jgi:hypothetical protein